MASTEQNLQDATAILRVARSLVELWPERPAACRVILRTALEQFWEKPRVTQGKRRDPKALWTADALSAGMAAQRQDRHTGQRSSLWDTLVMEPILPIEDREATLIELSNNDGPIEAIVALAEGTVAILTKNEHEALVSKGLTPSLPDGWRWGDDPWARFAAVGMSPEDFKPWAGLSADPFMKIAG